MDVFTIRLVAVVLGSICILCVGGIILVAAAGHEPPGVLSALATTCAGALVGLLVTPRLGPLPERRPAPRPPDEPHAPSE